MNHSTRVNQHSQVLDGTSAPAPASSSTFLITPSSTPASSTPSGTPASSTPASGTIVERSEPAPVEASKAPSRPPAAQAPHDEPLPIGDSNANPADLSLLELLAEDFRTHERDLTAPGFWAVALHRLGNARMGVRSKLLRAPLTVAYQTAFTGLNWLWGIDLCYTVKLGRRVRIWHHGGSVIGARAIGNDVHIRHNTTLGLVNRFEPNSKPIIGDRVDIGAGACILGAVTVGDDCVIGANSVVLRDLPPGATALGIPARPVNIKANGSLRPPEP